MISTKRSSRNTLDLKMNSENSTRTKSDSLHLSPPSPENSKNRKMLEIVSTQAIKQIRKFSEEKADCEGGLHDAKLTPSHKRSRTFHTSPCRVQRLSTFKSNKTRSIKTNNSQLQSNKEEISQNYFLQDYFDSSLDKVLNSQVTRTKSYDKRYLSNIPVERRIIHQNQKPSKHSPSPPHLALRKFKSETKRPKNLNNPFLIQISDTLTIKNLSPSKSNPNNHTPKEHTEQTKPKSKQIPRNPKEKDESNRNPDTSSEKKGKVKKRRLLNERLQMPLRSSERTAISDFTFITISTPEHAPPLHPVLKAKENSMLSRKNIDLFTHVEARLEKNRRNIKYRNENERKSRSFLNEKGSRFGEKQNMNEVEVVDLDMDLDGRSQDCECGTRAMPSERESKQKVCGINKIEVRHKNYLSHPH